MWYIPITLFAMAILAAIASLVSHRRRKYNWELYIFTTALVTLYASFFALVIVMLA